MSSRWQDAAWLRQWRRDGEPAWQHQFIRAGRYSYMVMCKDCGSTGLPGGHQPCPWQITCLIGHRYTCPDCGAPCHRLYQHQNCKIASHGKCCKHTDTQYRRLQRLVADKEQK